MPRYVDTLERVPAFSAEDDAEAITTLWRQLSAALEGIHALGFAHMDVKPSSICLDRRDFIFIDLYSVARFGDPTESTRTYIPSDLRPAAAARARSSAAIDWWMLAMTLAEKACGEAGFQVGSGATDWTTDATRALAYRRPCGRDSLQRLTQSERIDGSSVQT